MNANHILGFIFWVPFVFIKFSQMYKSIDIYEQLLCALCLDVGASNGTLRHHALKKLTVEEIFQNEFAAGYPNPGIKEVKQTC